MDELARFFAVGTDAKCSRRAARAALGRLGVTVRGKQISWRPVLEALRIDPDISDDRFTELTRPLMCADEIAAQTGVDCETIYRWHRKQAQQLPQPVSIGPRGLRWIRAEIEAWQGVRKSKEFARLTKTTVVFGALK